MGSTFTCLGTSPAPGKASCEGPALFLQGHFPSPAAEPALGSPRPSQPWRWIQPSLWTPGCRLLCAVHTHTHPCTRMCTCTPPHTVLSLFLSLSPPSSPPLGWGWRALHIFTSLHMGCGSGQSWAMVDLVEWVSGAGWRPVNRRDRRREGGL